MGVLSPDLVESGYEAMKCEHEYPIVESMVRGGLE